MRAVRGLDQDLRWRVGAARITPDLVPEMHLPDWLPPLLAAPFVGSLLGVLVRRLPRGLPVALDRSRCESCGHALGPAELVPLASYAVLRGRCRHCGAAISPFHPLIELAALLVAIWAATSAPDAGLLWADCVLGWTLLALGWIDWETMVLPDALTLPLILAGLGAALLLAPDRAALHAAGAALGWLGFRAVALAYRALRGRDGLGEGDAKLLAAAGAWVGPTALPLVVFLGALLGIALTLARSAGSGLRRETAVPFGPSLALAVWLVRLYGDGFLAWYGPFR